MKKILRPITLAAALFAVSGQPVAAQGYTRYVTQPLLGDLGSTVTNNVAILSTNTYSGLVLDVSNQDKVGIEVSCNTLISNATAIRLDFQTTVGGVYSTTNFLQVHMQTGTNDLGAGVACIVTNLDVSGLRAIRLFRIANTGGINVVTNLQVTGNIKR